MLKKRPIRVCDECHKENNKSMQEATRSCVICGTDLCNAHARSIELDYHKCYCLCEACFKRIESIVLERKRCNENKS